MRVITTFCSLLLASDCGWLSVQAKAAVTGHDFGIYGGKPINITEVPYMATFRGTGATRSIGAFCGAVIVHEQFLVTAAHCLKGSSKWEVVVGSDNVYKGTSYEVEKLFPHPKHWNNRTGNDYDVAVIKLKEHMVFSDCVKPIKMADSTSRPKTGDLMQVVGYGKTEHDNKPSEQLLMVKVPFVDLITCRKIYSNCVWKHVSERMICAGGEPGRGGCIGDSGGPLTYEDKLIGIVSWSHKPCAEKGWPDVYADVPSMRDFVEEVIHQNV